MLRVPKLRLPPPRCCSDADVIAIWEGLQNYSIAMLVGLVYSLIFLVMRWMQEPKKEAKKKEPEKEIEKEGSKES